MSYDSDCSSTFQTQSETAINVALARWSSVESTAGETLNCIYNKLTGSTKLYCTDSSSACTTTNPFDTSTATYAGETVFGHRTFCSNWISGINSDSNLDSTEKSICYAAVVVHETAHACLKFEAGAEEAEDAVRAVLNSYYGKSLTDNDCHND